jgi:hypothetical protein
MSLFPFAKQDLLAHGGSNLGEALTRIANIGRMAANLPRVTHNQPQIDLFARLLIEIGSIHMAHCAGHFENLIRDSSLLPLPGT